MLGRGRDNPEFIETSESTETLNVTSLVGKEPELLHEARYSRAHFSTRLGLWNQFSGEGLDSISVWSCKTETESRYWSERRWAGAGILVSPWLAVCTLGFLLVDERFCFLGFRLGNGSVVMRQVEV